MAGYIQYKVQNGIEYASFRVSSWDSEAKKHDKSIMNLGRVIDKDNLIFKNREHGIYQFDLENQSFKPMPDDYVAPTISRKSRTTKKFAVDDLSLQYCSGYELAAYQLIEHYFKKPLSKISNLDVNNCSFFISQNARNGSSPQYIFEDYSLEYPKHLYRNNDTKKLDIKGMLTILADPDNQANFFKDFFKILKDHSQCELKRFTIYTTVLEHKVDSVSSIFSDKNDYIEPYHIPLIFVIDESTGLPVYFKEIKGSSRDKPIFVSIFEDLMSLGAEIEYIYLNSSYSSIHDLKFLEEHNIKYLCNIAPTSAFYLNLVGEEFHDLMTHAYVYHYKNLMEFCKSYSYTLESDKLSIAGTAFIVQDLYSYKNEILKAASDARFNDNGIEEVIKAANIGGLSAFFTNIKDMSPDLVISHCFAFPDRADLNNGFPFSMLLECVNGLNTLKLMPSFDDEATDGYLMVLFLSSFILKELCRCIRDDEFDIYTVMTDLVKTKLITSKDGLEVNKPYGCAKKVFAYLKTLS